MTVISQNFMAIKGEKSLSRYYKERDFIIRKYQILINIYIYIT